MNNMKKLPLVVLIASLSACGGDGETLSMNGSSGGAGTFLQETTTGQTPGDTTQATDSAAYVSQQFQEGLLEIQLAQLAQDRAADDDTRKLAQRLLNQHTVLNDRITQLAQQKNISLPTTLTAEQQQELNNLSSLSGQQFDQAYLQSAINAHETAIASSLQQADQGTDPDVRSLASASAPLLKTHLILAQEVNGTLSPSAFVTQVYQDGLGEIQLSQLAVQQATDDQVRNYAQRMIDEHTQVNNQISTLAQQKNITLPNGLTPSQQAAANQLARLSGPDFDKAYMDMNVVTHAKDVRLARQQRDDTSDADIQNFARTASSRLTEHLIAAVEIDRTIEPSFLFRAYQDGLAEVALSLLALEKAQNGDVSSFAQQMVNEHTAVNAQVQQLSQQNNITLPFELSPEQTLALIGLTRVSGESFDQAYMAYNVRIHETDVDRFQQQAEQATDPAIQSFAQSTLPTLTEHLDQARSIGEQVGGAALDAVRQALDSLRNFI